MNMLEISIFFFSFSTILYCPVCYCTLGLRLVSVACKEINIKTGLTFSQMTDFRLFERVCRRHFEWDENDRKFSKLVENGGGWLVLERVKLPFMNQVAGGDSVDHM